MAEPLTTIARMLAIAKHRACPDREAQLMHVCLPIVGITILVAHLRQPDLHVALQFS